MDLMLERQDGPHHAYAYTGGKPFDPLPSLQAWDSWS